MLEVINLDDKLAQFDDRWSPRIIAELNGQQVKLAKVLGELVWHSHEAEDELFLVLRGRFNLRLRDGEVSIGPGEMYVVPRGVEHCPWAEEETHVLVFEPASTKHTGDVESPLTVHDQERI